MKPLAFLGLTLSLLVPACGDSGGATTDSGTTSGSTTTTTTTATTGTTAHTTGALTTGVTAGETTGAITTTTATTTTAATTDPTTEAITTTDPTTGTTAPDTSHSSTTGPGDAALAISLKDVFVYANCQPIIDPDNIIGFWTVVYDNSQGLGEAAATLTAATLHLSLDNDPSEHALTVTPSESGPVPAGMITEQEQTKQPGPPTPGCGICDTPYRLDLVFSSGGVEVPVSHEDILGCVY